MQISSFSWTVYDSSFKLMVLRYVEETVNCIATRKSYFWCYIRWQRKDNKEHLQSAGFVRKCVEVRTGNKSYLCWRIISENFSWTRHKVNFKKWAWSRVVLYLMSYREL
jgi:hypothetical protein